MLLTMKKGTTSKRVPILVQDKTSTVGAGLTGLVYNTATLIWTYWREDAGNTGGVAVTLATATRGTFASGGFVEKDATLLPGAYEIGIPDAALATGASWVMMSLSGGGNMAPVSLVIQLQDGPYRKFGIPGFAFDMRDSSQALKSGETVTAQRSIDGGAFANCTNSVSEIGTTGVYKVDLSSSDLDGSTITLKFTSAGTVPLVLNLFPEG